MIIMKGICGECNDGKEKRLAKRNPPLCGYHYSKQQQKKSAEKNKNKPKVFKPLKRTPLKRTPLKKPLKRTPLKRTPLTYKRKPTGELPLMCMIWNSIREHKSFISGEPISNFNVRNMAHVLPKAKNKYPKFKLHIKNIVLITWEEHDLWDNGLREELMKLPEWNKMFELESGLKDEYKKLYGK